jgi:broad specificity phosphatase PhoE
MNNEFVSTDRIRAWKDVPLVQEGKESAKKTGEALKSKGIQVIVASDLSRAKETADIIGKIIGVKPSYSEGLRPWDLGELTGKTTKEAIPVIKQYIKTPKKPVPKGESFDSFKHRAFAGIADAFDLAGSMKLCIVTHHRVERLIKSWIAAGQPSDGLIDLKIFGEKGEPPGKWEIISMNDSALRKIRKESMRDSIKKSVKDVKNDNSKG